MFPLVGVSIRSPVPPGEHELIRNAIRKKAKIVSDSNFLHTIILKILLVPDEKDRIAIIINF